MTEKPHIKRGRFGWLCAGQNAIGEGHSAREAYAQWLWAVESGHTNRAGWESGQ